MDSTSGGSDSTFTSVRDRTPSFDDSDSDDEYFDAVVADDDAVISEQAQDEKEQTQNLTTDETVTQIVDDLMQPLTKIKKSAEAENVRTTDDDIEEILRNDGESSGDDSFGTESGGEQSERPSEQEGVHPNRTEEGIESFSDAAIQEGLGAEEEEEDVKKEDAVDGGGGLIIDEEAMKELEEQMTEEEKQEKREEAQTHKTKGNELFKSGEYADAVYAYSQALQLCPLSYKKDRSIMYANRAASKVKQEDLESAITDCTKALELNPVYLKVVLRRAQAYELTDKLEDALKDYQRALELDPGCHEARAACMRLPDQIQERNEKLKAEMMSKLKELGNLCLRPFGLSTDNFQLNQDPATGSYSVNFRQNPGGNNGK